MFFIDAVRYTSDHSAIAQVRCTTNPYEQATQVCSKKDVIDLIYQGYCFKTKWKRNGIWYLGADVHVVADCYLRTDSNNTPSDNLGNLPPF